MQSDIADVEFAAKEEISRLDTELSFARKALHAAEQMAVNDASTYTNELTLRVSQVTLERLLPEQPMTANNLLLTAG